MLVINHQQFKSQKSKFKIESYSSKVFITDDKRVKEKHFVFISERSPVKCTGRRRYNRSNTPRSWRGNV